jgi:hypothetical protein
MTQISQFASISDTSKANLDAVATGLVTKMWKLAETNDAAGLEKFINKASQAQDADQPSAAQKAIY